MSTDVVKISNKAYTILQDVESRLRRRNYFRTYTETSKNTLTNEELKLLKDLGLNDSKMINTLKLYLPTFFDNLYMCSSDASMILHKNCNIPYFVLWSIMIANKQATDERLRENRFKESTHLLGVAINTATVNQLRPKLDEYDELFQLIVINPASPPIPIPLHHFMLGPGVNPVKPAVKPVKPAVKPVKPAVKPAKPRPNDRENAINAMFTIMLINNKNNSENENNATDLSTQLMELDQSRRNPPLYTFTQKGSTCASDSLFTILLQTNLIKQIFIDNSEQIIRNKLDKSLIHAFKRYINMLTLESTHVASAKGAKGRRGSINLTEKHGESILKTMSDDCSIGLTRTQITKYLTDLQAKLLPTIPTIKNLFFFNGGEFKTNIDNMTIGKKNLNNIQGILITHSESSSAAVETKTRKGHAIAIIQINDNWYISNNEIGMLELIHDQAFIPMLLYKLYNTTSHTDEIFKLHTQPDKTYLFNFANGYQYPVSAVSTDNVSIVDARRIIVFGENGENVENTKLTNIYKNFNKNDAEYILYLNTIL
jgi:hypothetical protein